MPSASTLFARQLRRDSTEAERVLWSRLRRRQLGGHKFRRQVPIGPYVVDFLCLEPSLVIEVDGSQHADRDVAHDRVRDDEIERRGFRVLRFWNDDINHRMDEVMEAIWSGLSVSIPPPRRLPSAPFGGTSPAPLGRTESNLSSPRSGEGARRADGEPTGCR
ncbi:MAG TPA: endonuclease domain-containing protein [Vineibacter sp.]|nr:endonuclease domain-containing protein [Vineibacter sp.]